MSVELPKITVIMPIRNESEYIERSLRAVLLQDYPKDKMEVLIADGMSTDQTREVISRAVSDTGISVKVVDNPDLIVPTGMNMAIKRAKGDIIIRIDGHTIIEPDYIWNCAEVLKRSGADNVGGPMRADGKNYISKGISLATSTPFGLGNSRFHYSDQEQFVDTVYMGAFRKETLFRVGLYDENFIRHQDYELNYRIRKSGGKIFLSPKIRSFYHVRDSLRKLWKQYFEYGYWKGRFVRKSPDSLKWRHLTPPALLLALTMCGTLSFFSKPAIWAFSLISGAYIVFLISALMSFTIKRKFKYLPVLTIILPCMHFSWGLGFWRGIFSKKLD